MASIASVSPDLLVRSNHSTIILDGKLCSWGGDRLNMPHEHDSDEKRNIISFVEVLDIPSLSWSRVPTVSIPPVAVMDYACANISDTAYYFGGRCKTNDCYHNDVFAFSTNGNKWNEILYTNTKRIPMKKAGSGMITFSSDEDYLLTIGGFGLTPATGIPSHSVYTPHPTLPNIMYTNEAHVLCISSSPAQWTVPKVTGTRPPPSAWFTLNTLPGTNRAVIFGGLVVDDTGLYSTNDVYLLTYAKDLVEYTKLECPSGGNCPKRRADHSSTVITANNSPHLLVIGGYDDHLQPTSDCWILDINKKKWKKIDFPDSVTRRFDHSISSYTVSDECVWIVITGGFERYNPEHDTNTLITDPDTTVLVELVYSSDGWSVTGIWNGEQLVSNKSELQTRLIQHIVKDRIHKGTATDLINYLTTTDSSVIMTKTEIQELRKTLREKREENEKLQSDLSVSNSRLEGYMKLLLEKEEHVKIYKKMSLVKTQELNKLQPSKGYVDSITEPGEQSTEKDENSEILIEGHVESVTEPEEHSTRKDDKTEILREEVDKLQSLVIEKDEELTQLNLKLANLDEVVSTEVKDQGTQFNYIIPVTDCLDQVHVAGEVIHLIQGSHTQSLNWSQWGLRMHFAENTVSATETCEVAVKALVGGKFKFPSGSQLISAVYAVSFASKVKKPVKVEIQHCALLKSKGQFQYLSFIKAPLRQKVPPFEFTPLKGGEFSLESQYGSITLDHFCLIAILMFKDVIVFIPLKITNDQEQRRDSGARNLQADGNSSETGSTGQRESGGSVDLSYTGQTYYECLKKANQWLMKFIAVKNLEALKTYIKENTPDAERDLTFRFTFEDSNRVLELVMDVKQEKPAPGWTILPHVEPLTILQKDMDDFGKSDGLPDPPTCLVTVFATVGPKTTTYLSYSVPIKGVVTKTKAIFVNRLLDPSASSSSSQNIMHGQQSVPRSSNQGFSSGPGDISAIVTCIKEEINRKFAPLKNLFEPSINRVAAELFTIGIISDEVQRNPSTNSILQDFYTGFAFMNTIEKVEQHCRKFFSVFNKIGGPFTIAGNSLKHDIGESISRNFDFNISFNS